MKIPKSIFDTDFTEDHIGFATHEDIKHLLTMDRGSVFVSTQGNIKYIPIARRTHLELIQVDNPEQSFKEHEAVYNKAQPTVNETRLAFIKEQREKFKYTDLGIHPHAFIGDIGMGYEWQDKWVEFPQVGGIDIGKHVRIGAFTTVKIGTIEDTVIGDGCKIGSHCNIGHNVQIGKHCLLTHRVSIGGSAVVGSHVFFGQGCIIKNKVKIGDGAVIGQGANVVKDVPPNVTVVGNPARIVID